MKLAHGLEREREVACRTRPLREATLEVLGVFGADVRRELRVFGDLRAAVAISDGLENRQRRHHERLVAEDELREVRVRRPVDEQVCETVGAGVDRVARAGEVADMHDCQLVAGVCGIDQRLHRRLVDRRELDSVRVAVVVDDLDVVRAFRDSRVDPRLGLGRRRERGDRHAVLRTVPLRRGREDAGRAEVGGLAAGGRAVERAKLGGRLGVGEHVEHGRDA
jgi:hypothetical protein